MFQSDWGSHEIPKRYGHYARNKLYRAAQIFGPAETQSNYPKKDLCGIIFRVGRYARDGNGAEACCRIVQCMILGSIL